MGDDRREASGDRLHLQVSSGLQTNGGGNGEKNVRMMGKRDRWRGQEEEAVTLGIVEKGDGDAAEDLHRGDESHLFSR